MFWRNNRIWRKGLVSKSSSVMSNQVLQQTRWYNKRILKKGYSVPRDFSWIENYKLCISKRNLHKLITVWKMNLYVCCFFDFKAFSQSTLNLSRWLCKWSATCSSLKRLQFWSNSRAANVSDRYSLLGGLFSSLNLLFFTIYNCNVPTT